MSVRRQPVRPAIVDWFLPLWALLPLEDLQDPVVRTCTLRKWNPRPACGTAFSSVHPILSVCGSLYHVGGICMHAYAKNVPEVLAIVSFELKFCSMNALI